MSGARALATRCCIAGGGPAGMMLGYLLARAGVDVIVLEKHGDFLRDFRGDTIHPSTLEIMHELGLLDDFLARPHQELRHISAQVGAETVPVADFSRLPTKCKFIAFMPQWDFLNFLTEHAKRLPNFRILMNAEVVDVMAREPRVTGLRAKTPDGPLDITALLVVGADGRHSIVREKAGLRVMNLGAPIDVLWLALSKRESDPPQSLGRADAGHLFIMLDRGDYWQCAFVIDKGGFEDKKRTGLEAFRAEIATLVPALKDRVQEIRTWEDVKLLTVAVDRLRHWHRPGLLCIGDAAHAMSPIGGVGINLAIQDAVAAANILAKPLRDNRLSEAHLRRVQQRRWFPTWLTQAVQVAIQKRVIAAVLKANEPFPLPFPLRMLERYPFLRRIPARMVGMGVQPEHVRSPRAG